MSCVFSFFCVVVLFVGTLANRLSNYDSLTCSINSLGNWTLMVMENAKKGTWNVMENNVDFSLRTMSLPFPLVTVSQS